MNQSPRNMYQCQMGKQTMGSPMFAYNERCDNKSYRILTPQMPLVRNQVPSALDPPPSTLHPTSSTLSPNRTPKPETVVRNTVPSSIPTPEHPPSNLNPLTPLKPEC